jgi:transposase-like protein
MEIGPQLSQHEPEVEVVAKARRRQFSAEYKRKILKEIDACKALGEVGAILRREGLYSSHLASWRAARRRGELAGLSSRKRGPEARPKDPRDRQLAELERENRRLQRRLARAETMIEIQKKVALLMGISLPEPDEKP